MDPLTALSLAGNVIQFVDFGSKLLSQDYELYKSSRGRLEMDEELKLITADLSGLIVKMRAAGITEGGQPATSHETPTEHLPQTTFQTICDVATKIARAILAKLDTLKIDDSKNQKLQVLKQVWKSLWSQNELDELLGRLSRLRNAINTQVLTTIQKNTNELNVRSSSHFERVDRQTQQILISLLESNQAKTFRKQEEIMQRREENGLPSLGQITVDVDILAVPNRQEELLRADVRNQILDHLGYPMMPKRYESVVEAHPSTFEWALEEPTQGAEGPPGDNLATWLRTGHGLYWVSGKPGSGKSTLMKHILDDDRTRLHLENWALMDESTPGPLVIATFFFWNSGTLEQRSQIDMLRSLLFQVLEQVPELLPAVFPALWSRQYGKWLADGSCVWSESWTLRNLLDAFKRLIGQRGLPIQLCFLIDGLDEFAGDHEVLAEPFKEIVCASDPGGDNHVKACVSSRPWVVFKENFAGCSVLEVQKLTYNDITRFVTEKFWANSAFRRLAEQEPDATSQLIQEVCAKAEGVFLWVHIVVQQLLKGFLNRDSISDLWGRLQALPRDLEPLYQRIMSQIDPVYLVWASKAFQLLRAVREVIVPEGFQVSDEDYFIEKGVLSIAELYLALDENASKLSVGQISQDIMDKKCRETDFHINARCACLLEVVKDKWQNEVTLTSRVQYFHRTAKDFLENRDRWSEILELTQDTAFDPY